MNSSGTVLENNRRLPYGVSGAFNHQIEQFGGGFRISDFDSARSVSNGLIAEFIHPYIPFCVGDLLVGLPVEPVPGEFQFRPKSQGFCLLYDESQCAKSIAWT